MNTLRNKYVLTIAAILLLAGFVLSSLHPAYAEPSYKVEDGKIERKLEKCTVNITYPIIKDHPDKKSEEKLNKILKDNVEKLMKEFLESYEKEKKDIERKWDLTTIYEVKNKSGDVFSVILFSGEYMGGAHPNPLLDTFVYSFKESKMITLKDMFKPGAKYLEKISEFCAKEITNRKISDEKWIKEGTAPKEENYQFFYLTNKGLVIVFPQYQVACYAAGNQEVVIPYDYLKDILDPKAPVVK